MGHRRQQPQQAHLVGRKEAVAAVRKGTGSSAVRGRVVCKVLNDMLRQQRVLRLYEGR
jgi:hypothetical protein